MRSCPGVGAGRRAEDEREGDDRLLYDSATGTLWYDPDGNKTAHAAVEFAVLDNKPSSLDAGDFAIV